MTKKAGNVIIDPPSWFNVTNLTDGFTMESIDVVGIDRQFEEEYGYK